MTAGRQPRRGEHVSGLSEAGQGRDRRARPAQSPRERRRLPVQPGLARRGRVRAQRRRRRRRRRSPRPSASRGRPRRRSSSTSRSTPPTSSRRATRSPAQLGVLPGARLAGDAALPEVGARDRERGPRRLGVIEVIPPEAPLTLFVWGLKRVLPVRLTELHDHRGGLRPVPEPDPRQGPPRAPGAQLPRPRAPQRRRRACSWRTRSSRRSWRRCGTPRRRGARGRIVSASATSGSEAMFEPDQPLRRRSRRHARAAATPTAAPRTIRYKRRRFLPPPPAMTRLSQHAFDRGRAPRPRHRALPRRPDAVLALCDANDVLRPEELEAVGRSIVDRDAATLGRRRC